MLKNLFHTNILKAFFDWLRGVLESADVPFVLLVLVVLPFVVPYVPAWVTANNLYEIMGFPKSIAFVGGATVELLGFAGAVLMIRYITDWVNDREKKRRHGMTVALTSFSYVFYLTAVIVINVVLDRQAGKPTYYVWVIFFLCLLSVPSGLLSASRIVNREYNERDERIRQEERGDKMERYRIKHGVQLPAPPPTPPPVKIMSRLFESSTGGSNGKEKYASDYRNRIATELESHYRRKHAVLGASELCRKLKLDPRTQRGEVWRQIQEWKRDRGL